MFDFQEKRKIRSWIYSKGAIALLLLLTAFLSVSAFERFKAERETAKKRAERAAELEVLKERAAALEARVEAIEGERGIESEIRDRYDVAKEGESVVIIVGEKGEQNIEELGVPPESKELEESRSFFNKLKFW